MIQCRLITENTIESAVIRFWTQSQWSHVDLIIPEYGYLGARPDGVEIRPWDYCKPTKSTIGTIDCSEDATTKIISAALTQLGKPYDWLDILGIVLRQDWEERNAWICSRLFFWVCLQGGIQLQNISELNRITPELIYDSPILKWVMQNA